MIVMVKIRVKIIRVKIIRVKIMYVDVFDVFDEASDGNVY